MIAYADEPPGRPSAAVRGAAERLGFTQEQVEIRRDIALPVPTELAAGLQDACAPYVGDFDVVTWRDAAPDALVDDLALLHQRMSTDVPMAELDITEGAFDGARVRRHEQLARDMGRTLSCAVTLAGRRGWAWASLVLEACRSLASAGGAARAGSGR